MSVRSVSTSSTQSECLRCTRDTHSPKLYPSANNMNPGVVPPQLLVRFYTSAILLLYYGLSLYLRSSALCHLGSNTSRSDACLSCDANHVHLPATTRSVWIQRTCHQPPSGCRLISNCLPRLPSELDVIIVRKEGTDQSHRDFHVRRNVLHRALQLLIMHNKYYRAI